MRPPQFNISRSIFSSFISSLRGRYCIYRQKLQYFPDKPPTNHLCSKLLSMLEEIAPQPIQSPQQASWRSRVISWETRYLPVGFPRRSRPCQAMPCLWTQGSATGWRKHPCVQGTCLGGHPLSVRNTYTSTIKAATNNENLIDARVAIPTYDQTQSHGSPSFLDESSLKQIPCHLVKSMIRTCFPLLISYIYMYIKHDIYIYIYCTVYSFFQLLVDFPKQIPWVLRRSLHFLQDFHGFHMSMAPTGRPKRSALCACCQRLAFSKQLINAFTVTTSIPGRPRRRIFRSYPLVNVDITMENHHFSWENSLFLWPCSITNC